MMDRLRRIPFLARLNRLMERRTVRREPVSCGWRKGSALYACLGTWTILLVVSDIRHAAAQGMLGGGSPGMMGAGSPAGPQAKKRREPHYTPAGPQIPVAEIRITGNDAITKDRIQSYLQTRVRRAYDAELVQRDVRTLMNTRLFRDVRTTKQETGEGIVVTFEVIEQPTIHYIRFEGNEVSSKKLLKQSSLAVGSPLNPYSVEEARRKVEQYYRDKGYADATVEIREGNRAGDRGVVFNVTEGERVKVLSTKVEGNTFMTDNVLETRAGLQTKHGIMWLINGQLKQDQLDEDVQRLIAFYRRFGYYQATVEYELQPSSSGKWVTVVFHVDEGPRFRVHDIKIEGNQICDESILRDLLELQPGQEFVLDQMQRDLARLRDHYGSQGYVFADIKAEPQFLLEDTGELDIVYQIEEGKPAHINEIRVNITGDHPHTKESVVKNYTGLSPLQRLDIRDIRAAERRIGASGLFLNDPARGVRPTIRIVPVQDEMSEEGVYPVGYDEEDASKR